MTYNTILLYSDRRFHTHVGVYTNYCYSYRKLYVVFSFNCKLSRNASRLTSRKQGFIKGTFGIYSTINIQIN